MTDRHLLVQEYEELTALLREDADWEGLRRVLASHNVDVRSTVLAGFFEDDVGNTYGALVLPDCSVALFVHDSGSNQLREFGAKVPSLRPADFAALQVALDDLQHHKT